MTLIHVFAEHYNGNNRDIVFVVCFFGGTPRGVVTLPHSELNFFDLEETTI